tara:strand:+ start:1891 stop:2253 length:363 start_codon:yes stop_codon:yes gene_type:complete
MTTSTPNELPLYDFSNDKPATEQHPEPKIAEKDILKDAIAKAEAAMAAKSAKRPLVKSKAAKTSPAKKSGKAGRIVGISKDENEFLQKLLLDVARNTNYDDLTDEYRPALDKLLARYNNK